MKFRFGQEQHLDLDTWKVMSWGTGESESRRGDRSAEPRHILKLDGRSLEVERLYVFLLYIHEGIFVL